MKKRKVEVDPDNGFAEFGGYMEAKIQKLEEQFQEQARNAGLQKSELFKGISIFVNGWTNPSATELKRIMLEHGGVFHHYQRNHTTFVIASNLPDVKIRQKLDTNKLISPKWIVDCLNEMKIRDYSKYLLYTNEKPSQPRLNFKRDDSKYETTLKISNETLNQSMGDTEISDLEQQVLGFTSQTQPKQEVDSSEDKDDFLNTTDEISKEEIDLAKALANLNDQVKNSTLNLTDMKSTTKTVPMNMSHKARTATDPNFLSEFFNNSRLHHISTLGAGFKQQVSDWRKQHDGSFPAREILKTQLLKQVDPSQKTVIMHIDMDCFFVSVGLKSHPHLKGFPIAVTHSKGGQKTQNRPGANREQEMNLYNQRLREKFNEDENVVATSRLSMIDDNNSLSEIASCSYEARKCGIKNGMFVGAALKLCPDLKTIPYDFEGYKSVASTLYQTIAKYTLDIEAVSCDEMYVDLTDLLKTSQVDCMEFVSYVRDEIKRETGCPCSAGIGSNRLQARLATKKAKPDGQFYLSEELVRDFMRDILITDLPGVGYSTAHQLKQLKWNTCGDLEQVSLGTLQQQFGKKFGDTLYNACRGNDDRPLVYEQIRKSVSVEVNYGIRFTEMSEVDTFMKQLCVELLNRLREIQKKAKQLTLKLMIRAKDAPVETMKFMGHGFCDSVSKSVALPTFTDNEMLIESNVLKLMHQQNIEPSDLRGIGLQLSKFEVDETNKNSNTLLNMFKKVAAKTEGTKKQERGDDEIAEMRSVSLEDPKQKPTAETGLDRWMKNFKEEKEKKPPEIPERRNSVEQILISPRKQDSSRTSTKKPNISIKSPGKRRGRPPKNSSFTRKPSNSNISEMFKAQKKEPKINPNALPDIDFDVLMELPEEIRDEILRDYERQPNRVTTTTSLAKPEPAETTVVKNDVIVIEDEPKVVETKKPIIRGGQPSSNNILLKRELLRAWIDHNKPNVKDVEVVLDSGTELIECRKINDLFVSMRYLFRIIKETENCQWHQVYFMILNPLQLQFQTSFSSKLFLEDDFNCKFCKN